MRINNLIELLPDMAVFVRVVELGSFTAVAQSLGRTPSSISRQISRLEKKLGVRLLMRTTRKLGLSEAGQGVFQSCSEMLSAAYSATEAVGNFIETPQGLIRASAPMTFGKIAISPHVDAFLRKYPEVDVQLILTDKVMDLIDDSMDFVIRIEQSPAQGLAARRLIEIKYVLCASPDYLERRGKPETPTELKGHDCLFFGDNENDSKWVFRRGLDKITASVRGRYIVNHSEAMLEAVQTGAGIGFLPFFTARKALERNKLIQLFPDWELITHYQGSAWILYLPNRYLPPKTRLFIDHLAANIKEDYAKQQP